MGGPQRLPMFRAQNYVLRPWLQGDQNTGTKKPQQLCNCPVYLKFVMREGNIIFVKSHLPLCSVWQLETHESFT